MQSFKLQGRIFIRQTQISSSVNVPIIQSEHDYLDLRDHTDLCAWLDVSNSLDGGGTPNGLNVLLQTSASKDEILWTTMATQTFTGAAVSVVPVLSMWTGAPLMRWVRWSVVPNGIPTAGQVWHICFRIWLVASKKRTRRSLQVASA